PRHHHVQHHQIGSGAVIHALQGFLPAGRRIHPVIRYLQQRFCITKYTRLVVDEQYVWRAHCVFNSFFTCGKRTENLLPLPGSLSTQMSPPWASTRRRAMASPNPVPLDDVPGNCTKSPKMLAC